MLDSEDKHIKYLDVLKAATVFFKYSIFLVSKLNAYSAQNSKTTLLTATVFGSIFPNSFVGETS